MIVKVEISTPVCSPSCVRTAEALEIPPSCGWAAVVYLAVGHNFPPLYEYEASRSVVLHDSSNEVLLLEFSSPILCREIADLASAAKSHTAEAQPEVYGT